MPKERVLAMLLVLLFYGRTTTAVAQGRGTPTVKYISTEAIYIDAGSDDGLSEGDTVRVLRNGRPVAELVVVHLATHSAACKAVEGGARIQLGDRVTYRRPARVGLQEAADSTRHVAKRQPSEPDNSRSRLRRSPPRSRTVKRHNQLRGQFSARMVWDEEMKSGGLRTIEPSLSGRIVIDDLAGSGLSLRVRHRSRLYHRSRTFGQDVPSDEWSHRLFEVALVSGERDSPLRFGLGRVLAPDIRGIGYLDGVHFAVRVHPNVRLGVAAGTEPDERDSKFRSDRRKYGAFVNYETGTYDRQRLSSTLALSGSYEQGEVSREFLYIQNSLQLARRLSIYQSAEIDINRAWRKAAEGSAITFSNLYVDANLVLTGFASMNFSYDARRNVHTYNSLNTPDSLFDAAVRQGVRGGFRLRLPADMSLSANGGVRFRGAGWQDNVFASVYYGIRHFPGRGQSVSARLSVYRTEFTRAYRPSLSYRLPVVRRLMLNLSGGGYMYRTGNNTTSSYYGDLNAYYNLSARTFAVWSFRQYFGGWLRSVQLQMELGVNL